MNLDIKYRKIFFKALIILPFFILCCTTENKTQLEGTWELVSGEYSTPDSSDIFPNSDHDRAILIFGKTHSLYIRQDTIKGLFWANGYTHIINGDSIIWNFIFCQDPKYIGHSFSLEYQMKDGQLIYKGILPYRKWGIHEHDQKLYEVWKRIE